MTRPRNGHNWRTIRTHWLTAVRQAAAQGQPLTCPRCNQPLYPTQRIDTGHRTDKAQGGPDTIHNTRPEHARCNRQAGAHAMHNRPRTTRW